MKKFFILLILFLTSMRVYADYMPSYADRNLYLGSGFILSKEKITVYKDKDENSEIIGVINGENAVIKGKKLSEENIFTASIKNRNIHLIPADNTDDLWFCVCVSQKDKIYGYVKKEDFVDYFSTEDFYNFFGRKNGLYLFRNIPDKYKKLYASSDVNSNIVDTFLYPKHISVWLMAKDWMLVKVTTYDGYTKTGWFKWRLDDGTVLVFPNLKE